MGGSRQQLRIRVSGWGSCVLSFTNWNGLRAGTYRARVVGDWGWRTRPNMSPAITIDDGADVTLDLPVEFLGSIETSRETKSLMSSPARAAGCC